MRVSVLGHRAGTREDFPRLQHVPVCTRHRHRPRRHSRLRHRHQPPFAAAAAPNPPRRGCRVPLLPPPSVRRGPNRAYRCPRRRRPPWSGNWVVNSDSHQTRSAVGFAGRHPSHRETSGRGTTSREVRHVGGWRHAPQPLLRRHPVEGCYAHVHVFTAIPVGGRTPCPPASTGAPLTASPTCGWCILDRLPVRHVPTAPSVSPTFHVTPAAAGRAALPPPPPPPSPSTASAGQTARP